MNNVIVIWAIILLVLFLGLIVFQLDKVIGLLRSLVYYKNMEMLKNGEFSSNDTE